MSWPSLFALLPNCEVECVNINQMVPVILKQASPLPATHPLPPLSAALTLSSHFPSPAFAATSFVLKSCHPKCLGAFTTPNSLLFILRGDTFFSLAVPNSQAPPSKQLLLTPSIPNTTTWESSSCAAKSSSPGTGALALSALYLDTVCSQQCHQPPWQLPSDNATAPHHVSAESNWTPGPGDKAQLGFSAKRQRRGHCITYPTPIPQLNLGARTSSPHPAEASLPSLAYGITQVTIFIFAKAVAMVR